mmetsp:Transcript_4173/g.8651  ORF Transcript_4173/g.8651 Transcript_4173/m.8651 type:complete len:164 (+) Transcript_4173:1164-1655(+)
MVHISWCVFSLVTSPVLCFTAAPPSARSVSLGLHATADKGNELLATMQDLRSSISATGEESMVDMYKAKLFEVDKFFNQDPPGIDWCNDVLKLSSGSLKLSDFCTNWDSKLSGDPRDTTTTTTQTVDTTCRKKRTIWNHLGTSRVLQVSFRKVCCGRNLRTSL